MNDFASAVRTHLRPATRDPRPVKLASVIAGSALLGLGMLKRNRSGLALAAIGGGLVWGGLAKSEKHDQVSVPYGRGIRVEETVTVHASPSDLYQFWRNFENLPRFMDHLESVRVDDEKRSHWQAKGPIGLKAAWDAEIINEVPNELIGWRSVDGSNVDNAGSVHFIPANRGTEVKVVLRYDPPGGALGAAISKLFGEDPARQVQEDLRRFKQLVETGEVATTEGQPTGR